MTPSFSGETRRPSSNLLQPTCFSVRAVGLLACVASLWSCSGEISLTAHDDRVAARLGEARDAAAPSPLALAVAEDGPGGDALRGGRLFDKFYEESSGAEFAPEDPGTPAREGSGGPDQDGTLRDGRGARIDNALGHNYRLKSFFGWDLRGAEGVYGPLYQDQPYVTPHNLLSQSLTAQDVAALIVDGADGTPAYGQVLPERDLLDVFAFVMAVREHELPRPSDIWQLDPSAPKGYVLAAGGDAAAGSAAIRSSCAGCHGASGTNLLFDDGEHSLGTLARTSAYEVWFKIVAGNPGTAMGSQVPAEQPGAVQAKLVLDVLAALCDRTAFPRGEATEQDVSAGDVRCGSYLR